MNRAKSTRRVMLLARMGSPTCRLHTGRPWLSPSSSSLARTTVHRVLLANTRLAGFDLVVQVHGPDELAEPSQDTHLPLELARVDILTATGDVPPQENTRRAPGAAESSTACAVPAAYPWTPRGTSTVRTPSHPATAWPMTSRSSVAPGITVICPVNASSFATLYSRHTPVTS